MDHNSLTLKLASLIGEGKTFTAVPTPVEVKSDPTKNLPGHLISNIKDYFASYLKGSSKTRLILAKVHPNTIKIDLDKWKVKVQSAKVAPFMDEHSSTVILHIISKMSKSGAIIA